jgi:hypothetical protein
VWVCAMSIYHIKSWPGYAWTTGKKYFEMSPIRSGYFQFSWVWFNVRHWIQVVW